MITDYRRTVLYLEAAEIDHLTKQVWQLIRRKLAVSAKELNLAMLRRDMAIEQYRRLSKSWES